MRDASFASSIELRRLGADFRFLTSNPWTTCEHFPMWLAWDTSVKFIRTAHVCARTNRMAEPGGQRRFSFGEGQNGGNSDARGRSDESRGRIYHSSFRHHPMNFGEYWTLPLHGPGMTCRSTSEWAFRRSVRALNLLRCDKLLVVCWRLVRNGAQARFVQIRCPRLRELAEKATSMHQWEAIRFRGCFALRSRGMVKLSHTNLTLHWIRFLCAMPWRST